MSVANVAAVDVALVAILATDATLTALVPDGIFWNVAPAGTRFVIIQPQTHVDEEGFRAPLYEAFRYGITARILTSSPIEADAAAYRIHELLEDQVLPGITGYTHMSTLRVERHRFPEIDAIDNDIRWWIAGGDYEIHVSPD